MGFMKSSFPEKRNCGYHFFVGLSSHKWGVEVCFLFCFVFVFFSRVVVECEVF